MNKTAAAVKCLRTLSVLIFLSSVPCGPLPAAESHDHGKEEGKTSRPEVREFSVAGIDYKGTKIWVPGTLIVYEGEKVRITLINNIEEPGVHGYAIEAFGVKVNVEKGTQQVVEFTADKKGLFPIHCHLHPKHIGGQLLVLERPK